MFPDAVVLRALRFYIKCTKPAYGTLPVVRKNRRLADSVLQFRPGTAPVTGMRVQEYDSPAVAWAINQRLDWTTAVPRVCQHDAKLDGVKIFLDSTDRRIRALYR